MFRHLEGDQVVIVSKGRWKTCDLYTYRDKLFAKDGIAFIRLNADSSTSAPHIRIDMLITSLPLFADQFGRLTPARTNKPLQVTPEGLTFQT